MVEVRREIDFDRVGTIVDPGMPRHALPTMHASAVRLRQTERSARERRLGAIG